MAEIAESLENRKRIERDWYDHLYQNNQEFSSLSIREGLLGESEGFFRMLISQYCKPGVRVLEIGCGEGGHSILAAQHGASVTGIDISQEGIRKARESAERVGLSSKCSFIVGDCEKLLFADNEFDVVIDHETLSSVHPTDTLTECLRVLKPGGVIIGIECFGHNPVFNLNRKIKSILGKRTRWATNNILKKDDLNKFRSSVKYLDVKYFHFLSVYAGPLLTRLPNRIGKMLQKPVRWLDSILLNSFLSSYCFKVVFKIVK